jgi:N-acyl-D-aspartate/D-glutamate deacylase
MYDIAINHGTLINPEDKTSYIGCMGISNGKISAIGTEELIGDTTINASGLIVCPGFIDVHGHIDGDIRCAELSLRQGVTTTIGGNCGLSPVDMESFFDDKNNINFVINQAELIGHSFSMRKAVGITDVYAPANENQIKEMEYLTEKALSCGACGLSFGLDYAPGTSINEILALSKVAAKYNCTIPIHTRVTSQNDLYSLSEAISISFATGTHVLVSHFVYQYGSGMMENALSMIDKAIDQGVNISIDSGMYTPWSTFIGTATFDEECILSNGLDLESMLVATGPHKGKRLDWDLHRELRLTNPDESIIFFTGDASSIYSALSKSYAMPSSDTIGYALGEGHPQIAGTFPKYFKHMVRERKDLNIIEAIRKATLLPAETFGLKQKGRLSLGMDADIVIFDINKIEDKADFPDTGLPDAFPEGIPHVIVNGNIALSNGDIINRKAGGVIKIL